MNPTAGGSVEWAPDGSGFYYTRYPQGSERPPADRHFYQTVWFHQLGTPVSADRYVIGRDFPRIAEIELKGNRDGNYLLAKVHNGDGGEVAFHVRDSAGQWTQVAGFADGVKQMAFGDDGRLYAMSVKDALARPHHRDPAGSSVARERGRRRARKRTSSPKASTPTKSRLYVTVPRRRTVGRAHVRTRRQAPGRRPGRTDLGHQHRHRADRRRRPGAHDELRVAADVVPLRRRARQAGAHAAHQQAFVQFRRRHGTPRRRRSPRTAPRSRSTSCTARA